MNKMPSYTCKSNYKNINLDCKKENINVKEILQLQEMEEKQEDNWFCQKCNWLNKMPEYTCKSIICYF